jgi:hypothetical protein
MSDESVQRFIADCCLVGIGAEAIEARAARFGVSNADVAALAANPHRLGLYRRLVRTNLLGVTMRMMPRTRNRLNRIADGCFDATFDAFLAESAPKTHYLRDVPGEFLAWAAPRWEKRHGAPSYATDLARHELIHFQVAAAPLLATPPHVTELRLDRRVIFAPTTRGVRYSHAVHLLPDDLADLTVPEERDVSLLLYRDVDHAIRTLELSPFAALVATSLLGGETLGDAMTVACADQGTPLSPDVLRSTARVLADWGERGILLGAAP